MAELMALVENAPEALLGLSLVDVRNVNDSTPKPPPLLLLTLQ
jgi:hypothetical protein